MIRKCASQNIKCLAFADDPVIMSEKRENVQALLDIAHERANECGSFNSDEDTINDEEYTLGEEKTPIVKEYV